MIIEEIPYDWLMNKMINCEAKNIKLYIQMYEEECKNCEAKNIKQYIQMYEEECKNEVTM
jgi:hypothetical protein